MCCKESAEFTSTKQILWQDLITRSPVPLRSLQRGLKHLTFRASSGFPFPSEKEALQDNTCQVLLMSPTCLSPAAKCLKILFLVIILCNLEFVFNITFKKVKFIVCIQHCPLGINRCCNFSKLHRWTLCQLCNVWIAVRCSKCKSITLLEYIDSQMLFDEIC